MNPISFVVSDLTSTLVDSCPMYVDALLGAQQIFDGNVELKITMGEPGIDFRQWVLSILVKANATRLKDGRVLALKEIAEKHVIPYLTQFLIRASQESQVTVMPGLKTFLDNFKDARKALVTGDLRKIVKEVMSNTTLGDLGNYFPKNLWICADNIGINTRLDQVMNALWKLKCHQDEIGFMVDDARSGIIAMRAVVDY